MIGSSNSADLSFPEDKLMASEHCKLSTSSDGSCDIECLGKATNVVVNDKKVRAAALSNQDQLVVGSSSMTLTIKGAEHTTPLGATVDGRGPADIKEKVDKKDYEFKLKENGVWIADVELKDGLVTLLYNLFEDRAVVATFLNLEKLPSEDEQPSGNDLLADFPNEIRDKHKLILLEQMDLDLSNKFIRQGAASIGVCGRGISHEELAQRVKILAGWFVDPNLLNFHIDSGTEFFINSLFEVFDVLLVPDVGASFFRLYHRQSECDSWQKFRGWVEGIKVAEVES